MAAIDIANPGVNAAALKSALRDNLDEFYALPNIRTVSGTTDTIVDGDLGNVVRYTSNSSITITVPIDLGEGFTCLLLQLGTGVFTVVTSGTVIINLNSQFSSAGTGSQCSLLSDADDHFIFGGDTA